MSGGRVVFAGQSAIAAATMVVAGQPRLAILALVASGTVLLIRARGSAVAATALLIAAAMLTLTMDPEVPSAGGHRGPARTQQQVARPADVQH